MAKHLADFGVDIGGIAKMNRRGDCYPAQCRRPTNVSVYRSGCELSRGHMGGQGDTATNYFDVVDMRVVGIGKMTERQDYSLVH